jgi:flagellar M-ring protein FliF
MKARDILKVFKKLTLIQQAILVCAIFIIVALFIFIGHKSAVPSNYPLYGVDFKLPSKEIAKIQDSLKSMSVEYSVQSDQIFVKDEETAMKVKTQLGLDGIVPDGIKGWELFDNQPFTTTDFERKVNVRRAITDNIKKHLELLDDVKSADVVISFGEEKYFADDKKEFPLTASIVINAKPGSDILTNKNKIRGLRDLIAKGVDELSPNNVVIMDANGNVLTKNLEPNIQDENIQIAKEHLSIKEQERMKIYEELKKHLARVFTDNRFDVKVNLELNWDVEKSTQHLILPTVIKPQDPNVPYDNSIVKESVTVSQKNTKETFKGQGYIPEGPAGIEDQVPPGLKEKMDRYNTYEKNETINNQEFSKADKEIVRQPYVINKITVSVFLDGVWKKLKDNKGNYIFKNGTIKREYTPVADNEVREIENSIKALVGFDNNRGDSVAVNSVQFDRTDEFAKEDLDIFNSLQKRRFIISAVLGLLGIFVLLIILRVIRQSIDRRRRLREEELLREQEALRLSALNSIEEDSNFSLLDKATNEMQEQAVRYAKEKPEDVAKLIRTWLNSDD